MRTVRTILSAAIVLALVAPLSGCGIVRTAGPAPLPDSPSAAGPTMKPYVPSEHPGDVQVPIAGKVEPAPSGAYLGAYVPKTPWSLAPLDTFEQQSGRHVSIVMWYQPWAVSDRLQFDAAACLAVMRRGSVPMITWEPWDPAGDANALADPANQPKFKLSEINAGYYDDYIKSWAWDIKRLGGPVMLRPLHEMNGTWYPWGGTVNGNSPAQFIAAWRRIHDIFQREGATNVTWVWSVNGESVPDNAINSYASYYPGDAYVDWTAISSFNWGTSYPTSGGWHTWTRNYSRPLAYLTTLSKPICIAEMSSVEQGGSKAAWLTDAYAQIAARPQIKAVVFYDSLEVRQHDTEDWRITSSPAATAAYRSAIASPYFVSTPPAALTDWAAELKMTDWTYLGSLTRVY